MKTYYSKTSIKYLQKLERNIVSKIVAAIDELPNKGDIAQLKGQKVKNLFRLRTGKYRIIYSMEKETLKIIKIDTRGDAYK